MRMPNTHDFILEAAPDGCMDGMMDKPPIFLFTNQTSYPDLLMPTPCLASLIFSY